MPLIHGKSKKAFEKNIKTEMKHGKPQDQALAIAYNTKRAAMRKAKGGMVQKLQHDPNYADGGEAQFVEQEAQEIKQAPKEHLKSEMKHHPQLAEKIKKKVKMAHGGVAVDGDPYREGEHIPNTEYHESMEEQAHDDIDDPKRHQSEASHVGLMMERAEHPDVAGMVMKIMQNKADQMKMAQGGMVHHYADGDEVKKDPMGNLEKSFGYEKPVHEKETVDYKIKKFFGAAPERTAGESSYSEGGEIPEPSRSHQPPLGFEDSDHEDDDFLSQDEYMNEYMDQVEDTPEMKKKKMLSGIMASIAKENYGRNK